MKDKMKAYKNLGYNFKLICDHKELNIGQYAGNWNNCPRLERGVCGFESRLPYKLIGV